MYTYFLFFKKFIEQEPSPNILKKKQQHKKQSMLL